MNTVETLIFSVIAIVILFPILFFLPLGLTFKGKILTATTALAVSLLSTIAIGTFAFWQLILLTILLLMMVAYISSTRFSHLVLIHEETADSYDDGTFTARSNEFLSSKQHLVDRDNDINPISERSKEGVHLQEVQQLIHENVMTEQEEYIEVLPEPVTEDIENEMSAIDNDDNDIDTIEMIDKHEDVEELLYREMDIIDNGTIETASEEQNENSYNHFEAIVSPLEELFEDEEMQESSEQNKRVLDSFAESEDSIPLLEPEEFSNHNLLDQEAANIIQVSEWDLPDGSEIDFDDDALKMIYDKKTQTDTDNQLSTELEQWSEEDFTAVQILNETLDNDALDILANEDKIRDKDEHFENEILEIPNLEVDSSKALVEDKSINEMSGHLTHDEENSEKSFKDEDLIDESIEIPAIDHMYSEAEGKLQKELEQSFQTEYRENNTFLTGVSVVPVEDNNGIEISEDSTDLIYSKESNAEMDSNNEELKVIDGQPLHNNDGKELRESFFQKQLFDTFLLQIKHHEKSMSPKDLELYIKGHMHDQMSEQTYYMFANELLKLYAQTNQIEKFHLLTKGLNDKFVKYPVLQEQIKYIYEQFLLNSKKQ